MSTKDFELPDRLDQVLKLLGKLSRTEKMIVARKIESEMIDFKLTEMDLLISETNSR